jgi:hypothetical protein
LIAGKYVMIDPLIGTLSDAVVLIIVDTVIDAAIGSVRAPPSVRP